MNTFVFHFGKLTKVPDGYKKIHTHLIYTVKHDGRHEAHMVDDSCLTNMPLDSVYSGVVSPWGLRLALFFSKLKTWIHILQTLRMHT